MSCSQSAGNSNMLKILSTLNFEGKTYSKPILENNIALMSPTNKMDGGHEIRAKSVWEIRIIKILDLPPQRDNSLKVGRSK